MTGLTHFESLDLIRRLPFVRTLKYTPSDPGHEHEGRLVIGTPGGRFQLAAQAKQTSISSYTSRQFITWLNHSAASPSVILLARHISRPAAEALIEARINFADDAGNVHLRLGDVYNWTAIGMPAPIPLAEQRADSPAQLQLLFQFVTDPASINWPVRQLESAAGISKSKAALARRQMIAEGLLTQKGKQFHLGPMRRLAERLTSGYAQMLRPKLTLGRFRAQEKTIQPFLARLRREPLAGVRYSLTGAPAADLLAHFYQGQKATLFVTPPTRAISQQLRLLPDREGPITLLRGFGELVFWEKRKRHMIAPPWLIYAELLSSDDPRAFEAAEELRRGFLE